MEQSFSDALNIETRTSTIGGVGVACRQTKKLKAVGVPWFKYPLRLFESYQAVWGEEV